MSFINYDFSKITTFVFDVDGVLSDGTVIALESGEQARRFYIKDGYAIESALQAGYRVAVISAGNQAGTRKRLEFLHIPDIILGVPTNGKLEAFEKYRQTYGLRHEEILYMGDDMPDLLILQSGVLAACPEDASEDIKSICHFISLARGGNGAVRDAIERVLKAQSKWGIKAGIRQ